MGELPIVGVVLLQACVMLATGARKTMVDFAKFIEDTNNAQSAERIFELFQEQLAEIGFDRVLYTLATDHNSIGIKAGHGIMRNYPEDWMRHYTEQKYEAIDPVIKHAFMSNRPFIWDDMHKIMPFTQEQKKLINESKESKLYSGIGLGIHGPNNEVVAMGFASSSTGVDLRPDSVSMVKALANQFHHAYTEFARKQGAPKPTPFNINLTRKELEVLKWTAAGKSNSVIAEILHISENTVDYHMRQIFKKLDVNDRILAVVKAITYGLVQPE